MINKYKFNNSETEFLVYGELSFPYDKLECQLVEKNINLNTNDNRLLPIMFVNDLLLRTLGKKKVRTRDVILSEYNIESFCDLSINYNQIRTKVSLLPKSVRDHVVDKYTDLVNMEWKELEEAQNENDLNVLENNQNLEHDWTLS